MSKILYLGSFSRLRKIGPPHNGNGASSKHREIMVRAESTYMTFIIALF